MKGHAPHADFVRTQEIGPYDVLLGRGSGANENPGNIRFRTLVEKHMKVKSDFLDDGMVKKRYLAQEIVGITKLEGGRFLKPLLKPKDEKKSAMPCHNTKKILYEIATDDIAVSKVIQCFRYVGKSKRSRNDPVRKTSHDSSNRTSTFLKPVALENSERLFPGNFARGGGSPKLLNFNACKISSTKLHDKIKSSSSNFDHFHATIGAYAGVPTNNISALLNGGLRPASTPGVSSLLTVVPSASSLPDKSWLASAMKAESDFASSCDLTRLALRVHAMRKVKSNRIPSFLFGISSQASNKVVPDSSFSTFAVHKHQLYQSRLPLTRVAHSNWNATVDSTTFLLDGMRNAPGSLP